MNTEDISIRASDATITLHPITIPASMQADEAGDFAAMVEVRNAIYRALSGDDDESVTAEELLPGFQSEYQRRIAHLILVDGTLAGRATQSYSLDEGANAAEAFVELLPEFWSRGVGSAVLRFLEDEVRAQGRTTIRTWAMHQDSADVERITSPQGLGSVPHDRIATFLLQHGYELGQVERRSALDLHALSAGFATTAAEAAHESADYEVVSWALPTPDSHISDYAVLKSRMSTDAPSGGLDYPEETWDDARIREYEARVTRAHDVLVTAARHRETGALVAFNELAIGHDPAGITHQWDTLVLAEHRGHRLGALVKTAGVEAWRSAHPESPRVVTYNAEENRPMLAINEAIGFVPTFYNGGWKKRLTPPPS